jgi:hypothetical protein
LRRRRLSAGLHHSWDASAPETVAVRLKIK